MESLRQRIENRLFQILRGDYWLLQRVTDQIMVEFENEIAYRKAQEAETDEGSQEPELPL